MRGSESNKATYNSNQQLKKSLLISYLIFNILMGVIYIYNGNFNYMLFIYTTLPEVLSLFFIWKISKPVIKKENNIETLVSPGVALSSKGLPSMLFDVLFVSMVTKIGVLWTYKLFTLYAFIPIILGYELLYKPYCQLRDMAKKNN